MKKRILSAAVLIAIIVACAPFMITRVLCFMVIGCLCAYEYSKNLETTNVYITLWVLISYLIVNAFLSITKCGLMTYLGVYVISVLVSLYSGIIHKKVSAVGAINTVSVLSYPCFLFAICMLIAASDRWAETCGIAIISSILCDSFALFGGMLFGKHKLAPDISPNKTIEGAVCGAIFSLLGGFVVYLLSAKFSATPLPLYVCLITAFVSSTLGQIGDLSESMIKRYLNIKDFSNLIPGHGGMFDRADAIIFAIPTAYFMLYLFGFHLR